MEAVLEQPQVKSHASIASNTVILKVSFGKFGNSRKLPISVIAGAESTDSLKLQKTLLDSPELKAIENADVKMRMYLKSQCLPYEQGLDILPYGPDGTYLKRVHEQIMSYGAYRETLVDVFIEKYAIRIGEAKANAELLAERLQVPFSDVWKDSDFPSPQDARKEFYFTYGYHSFAVPPELVLAGVYDEAKTNAENKLQRATDNIVAIMRQGALELVQHLDTMLAPTEDGKKHRLHKTAVTNIADFVADFKARNIANDTELEAVMEKLGTMIQPGFDVDKLKDDTSYQSEFSMAIGSITSQLQELVEKVPGRKFKDLE
jgi:hypothetical protein